MIGTEELLVQRVDENDCRGKREIGDGK